MSDTVKAVVTHHDGEVKEYAGNILFIIGATDLPEQQSVSVEGCVAGEGVADASGDGVIAMLDSILTAAVQQYVNLHPQIETIHDAHTELAGVFAHAMQKLVEDNQGGQQ